MSKLKKLVLQDAVEILFTDVWKAAGDERELCRLERRARGHIKFLLERGGAAP